MNKEAKITTGLVLLSIAALFVGAYFFTRPQKERVSEAVSPQLLIKSDSHKITAPNEKLTLVEFGDFQCPACSAYNNLVKQILSEKKDTLSFVFRNFPLSQHKNARVSAYAAEAAGMQGKYWEMHDKIYETQAQWSTSGNPKDIFTSFAKDLGLNESKFKSDMELPEVKTKIDEDYSDGVTLNIDSTPTFYLNNRKVKSPNGLEELRTLVQTAEQQ